MAEVLQSVSATLRLNNGSDSQGNIVTIGQNFPSINKTTYDESKVLAISTAIGPVLDKSLESVQAKKTYTLVSA